MNNKYNGGDFTGDKCVNKLRALRSASSNEWKKLLKLAFAAFKLFHFPAKVGVELTKSDCS
jgi:hypothetical protein